MGLQQGTKRVNERSASRATFTFLDAVRAVAVPTSARYRIDDVTHGGKITIVDWTTIASPSSKQQVTVTAEQNRILVQGNEVETRVITIEGTGTDGEPIRETFTYEIQNAPSRD